MEQASPIADRFATTTGVTSYITITAIIIIPAATIAEIEKQHDKAKYLLPFCRGIECTMIHDISFPA